MSPESPCTKARSRTRHLRFGYQFDRFAATPACQFFKDVHFSLPFANLLVVPCFQARYDTEAAYYRTVGYREEDGRLESTDAYIGRMTGIMVFYAAITQVSHKLWRSSSYALANPIGVPRSLRYSALLVVQRFCKALAQLSSFCTAFTLAQLHNTHSSVSRSPAVAQLSIETFLHNTTAAFVPVAAPGTSTNPRSLNSLTYMTPPPCVLLLLHSSHRDFLAKHNSVVSALARS